MDPFSLDHIFSINFVPLRVALRLTTLRNLSRQVFPVPMDRPRALRSRCSPRALSTRAKSSSFFLPLSCQRTRRGTAFSPNAYSRNQWLATVPRGTSCRALALESFRCQMDRPSASSFLPSLALSKNPLTVPREVVLRIAATPAGGMGT